MKTFPGKITICRVHGGDKDYVSITIVDSTSTLEVAEIKMDFAEFGEALTGMGRIGCTINFNDSQNIGKKYEVKKEVVKLPMIQDAKESLQKYEIDGWIADIDSALNHHNWRSYSDNNGLRFVEVTFRRWV